VALAGELEIGPMLQTAGEMEARIRGFVQPGGREPQRLVRGHPQPALRDKGAARQPLLLKN
jgi:hypothetical protein